MISTTFPLSANDGHHLMSNSRRRIIVSSSAAILTILLMGSVALAQQIARPFPFTIPAKDTTASQFLPTAPTEVAGIHGPVHIGPNGHIIAKDGTRLRLFSTSLTGNAQFIADTDARRVAYRLHKLGFNAVRLYSNDYWQSGYDDQSFFFYKDAGGKTNKSSYVVNPLQIARFDTLLYELKQHGIYVLLQLNTNHHFTTTEGVTYADSTYATGSMLTEFVDPVAAQLHRDWARTFLSHVNPLTGMRYADDPQIVVVEYVNEHALYYYWTLDRLNYIGESDKLNKGKQTISYTQSRHLDSLYNQYLNRKYHSDAGLASGWAGNENVTNANLISDGSFENPTNPVWSFTNRNGAQGFKLDADGGVDSSIFVKVKINSIGNNPSANNIVLQNVSTLTKKDALYEITFWTKMGFDATRPTLTTRPITLFINAVANGVRGPSTTITIDTAWKKYNYVWRSPDSGLHSLFYQLGASLGDVWIDAINIHAKAEVPFQPGELLSTQTVQRLTTKNLTLVPLQRIRDQVAFYDSLQQDYFTGMDRVIKDTIKFKGLVNHSQNNYWALLPDIHAASGGDVAGYHNAWDFYGSRSGKSYTDSTWQVRNYSMLKSKSSGVLPSYVANSAQGKAFIADDFEVPVANQYAAEQMLLLPVFGALQDWDGIVFGPYAAARQDLFSDRILNPFHEATSGNSIANNTALLAMAPIASRIFRDGIVPTSDLVDSLVHDADDVWLTPTYSRGIFGVEGNIDGNIATQVTLRQHFGDKIHKVAAEYPFVAGDTASKICDSSRVLWDQTNGILTVNHPTLLAAAGVFAKDTAIVGSMHFSRLDAGHDLLTFAMLALDSVKCEDSKSALFAISTRAQNTGLQWGDTLGFGKNWGTQPMVMSAAKLYLQLTSNHDSLWFIPLDGKGQEQNSVKHLAKRSAIEPNKFEIVLDQVDDGTAWYHVVASGIAAGVEAKAAMSPSLELSVSPNPASSSIRVGYSLGQDASGEIVLMDVLGRVLYRAVVGSEMTMLPLNFATLGIPSGDYVLRLASQHASAIRHLSVIR